MVSVEELVDSLMNMVNTIIVMIILIIAIYVFYYLIASILTRKRSTGSTILEIVKEPVVSIHVYDNYLVFKTISNSIYTFNEPVSIAFREIKPYVNMGYILIFIGIVFFTSIQLTSNFLGYILLPFWLNILTTIVFIVIGVYLILFKTDSLFIETRSGSKTVFRKISIDPVDVERIILEYVQKLSERGGSKNSSENSNID
ncbi:MAG: hypothetical protein QXP71_01760 [Desulfurococcaceae archaeon]